MKNWIKNIISLIFLGVLVFIFQDEIARAYYILRDRIYPCGFPIAYTIGEIDPRFGVERSEFLNSINKAENIWEKGAGKNLFSYEENGRLKINLVYDERQATTTLLKELDSEIASERTSYEKLKEEYDRLLSEYQRTKNTIDLTNREAVDAFNAKIDRMNALAVELNKSAKDVNRQIGQYNKVGSNLGKEFEEGVYRESASGEEIDIYQFENRTNLVRVLAHELGHALKLDHSGDKNSIMYYLNYGENLTLSADDLSMLKTRCEIK